MTDIIKAKAENAAAVAKLEKDIFTPPWREDDVCAEIQSPDGHVYLAVGDGDVSGYFIMHRAGAEGELYRIAVSENFRRCGIGDMLMEKLKDVSKEEKFTRVFLEVRAGNAGAIALYEKHGFENIGVRKNYYNSPKEDAVIMVWEVLS